MEKKISKSLNLDAQPENGTAYVEVFGNPEVTSVRLYVNGRAKDKKGYEPDFSITVWASKEIDVLKELDKAKELIAQGLKEFKEKV